MKQSKQIVISFFLFETDNQTSNVLYEIPHNGTAVNGSSGENVQSITVQWGQTSNMTLQFTVNGEATEFVLSKINISIDVTREFSDAKGNFMACSTLAVRLVLLILHVPSKIFGCPFFWIRIPFQHAI